MTKHTSTPALRVMKVTILVNLFLGHLLSSSIYTCTLCVWSICLWVKKEFWRTTSILDLLPQNTPLGWGWGGAKTFTFSWSLTPQMLHTKFGIALSSSSWEELLPDDGQYLTHKDGSQPIARGNPRDWLPWNHNMSHIAYLKNNLTINKLEQGYH